MALRSVGRGSVGGYSMNKVVKGIIAAGLGVALLGGGAGSLAYWQDADSTESLPLYTGYVKLDRYASPAYTLNGESITYANLTEHYMVPGDTITYQQGFVFDLRGTDAVLRVSDLTFGSTPSEVVDAVNTSVTVTAADRGGFNWSLTPTIEQGAFNISGYGGADVLLTVEMPEGLEDQASAFQILQIDGLAVTATQVAAPLEAPLG